MITSRLFVTSLITALSFITAACGDDSSPTQPSQQPRADYSQTDLRVGTGTEATNGRTVTVNYTGWFYNPSGTDGKGSQFDSSSGRGPFSFLLGGNGVISGWNRGVLGMRVGGQRRFVLPPELAYGSAGSPPTIPGNATLVFEVELLNVQ
jgi:FKBP-type peptidyl-prolyl cis-trans isomerase FkpA